MEWSKLNSQNNSIAVLDVRDGSNKLIGQVVGTAWLVKEGQPKVNWVVESLVSGIAREWEAGEAADLESARAEAEAAMELVIGKIRSSK